MTMVDTGNPEVSTLHEFASAFGDVTTATPELIEQYKDVGMNALASEIAVARSQGADKARAMAGVLIWRVSDMFDSFESAEEPEGLPEENRKAIMNFLAGKALTEVEVTEVPEQPVPDPEPEPEPPANTAVVDVDPEPKPKKRRRIHLPFGWTRRRR